MRQTAVNGAADRADCQQLGFRSDFGGELIYVFSESLTAASVAVGAEKSFAIQRAFSRAMRRIVERLSDRDRKTGHVVDLLAHVAPFPFQPLWVKMR